MIREVIQKLGQEGSSPSAVEVARLSGLAAKDASEFREAWSELAPERRRAALQLAVQLAENDVELDFSTVFTTCLADPDEDVRATAIEGLWESEDFRTADQLARALRIDKACLAGLEATLRHYQRGEATREIPIWRMISRSVGELEARARQLQHALGSPRVTPAPTRATIGGGSLPQETLPSWALAVAPDPARPDQTVATLARLLRQHEPPIVGRIEQDTLWLDLRTVDPGDDPELLAALRRYLVATSSSSPG